MATSAGYKYFTHQTDGKTPSDVTNKACSSRRFVVILDASVFRHSVTVVSSVHDCIRVVRHVWCACKQPTAPVATSINQYGFVNDTSSDFKSVIRPRRKKCNSIAREALNRRMLGYSNDLPVTSQK